MREFITHVVLIPDFSSEGLAAYTSSTGPVVFDSDGLRQYIMVHELSHQLDWHARSDLSSGAFSDTGDWQDNYNQDSAVVSEYARTSWAENFAETGVIGVYDKLVDGGFGAIQSNWNDVRPGAMTPYHVYPWRKLIFIPPRFSISMQHTRAIWETSSFLEIGNRVQAVERTPKLCQQAHREYWVRSPTRASSRTLVSFNLEQMRP